MNLHFSALIKTITLAAALVTATLTATATMAVTPSAAQIQQFKNLPPAQQQALAKQYGINLSDLGISNTLPQPSFEQSYNANLQASTGPEIPEANSPAHASTTLDQALLNEPALQPFGYDLFDNNPLGLAPAADIPIPDNYVMGPGDNLVVQLYGKENGSYALTINREGDIQFPEIGPISIAGLSFTEAKKLLQQTVEQQMIGVRISTTMGSLRSIRVFILGDARNPGSYTVSSLATMTNALLLSGGVETIGSLRNIQLKRQGKIVTTLDLYDLLLHGDTSKDARLLPGDVIFIPPVGKTVGVEGEVRRPALYELKNETTAQQAIQLAGGFLPTAYPQASRIERINQLGSRTILDVNLEQSQGLQTRLRDADVLQVFSVLETVEDVVMVEGHIKRPGGFAFKTGQRFTDIVRSVHDLLPNPDLNAALIIREQQPTRQITTLLFSPAKAFAQPTSDANPKLQARDKLVFFNYQDNRTELLADTVKQLNLQANNLQRRQVTTINGSVRFPGIYPLTVGMNAQDLITLAGGLSDRAYSIEAEITRYQFSDSQQQSIMHLTVDLTQPAATALIAEDYLRIKHMPNWVGTETVTIEGEVAFPGTYTIQRGETLSQVIKRAGGLNEYAFVNAAVFTREQLRINEASRLKELEAKLEADIANSNIEAQNSNEKTALEDAEQLLDKLQNSKATGRMVIDLAQIMAQPDISDVILKNGDKLTVPRYRQAVTVIGEVQFATSHIYAKDLNVEDYIASSGNTTQKADEDRIYIVKANGSVFLPSSSSWFSHNKNNGVEPGDTIVVPYDSDRMKPLPFWSTVSQIFYQIALGAAAVNSF
ncbi:SLBB domain-containing protein [Dasania sp. GY-MA-18]|uniref:SLBB domain-containing protein n=1 Tax=Dasania phycosphaerae TaxID=2950436 RepID=A0A9J6RPB5_9GAMM|nr:MULTISPECIES: SLBB domain-containing protein [Dasania]MCR8923744.1 SLBB domain-containing protein [Dasania sp. GY-MA-18]MCZ0866178.1 SLBB domain-containing protein [Dasania phycosphaerae]MCZ0869902.1 SLBB domain-containing protein [Dasania phycosphaerae]